MPGLVDEVAARQRRQETGRQQHGADAPKMAGCYSPGINNDMMHHMDRQASASPTCCRCDWGACLGVVHKSDGVKPRESKFKQINQWMWQGRGKERIHASASTGTRKQGGTQKSMQA